MAKVYKIHPAIGIARVGNSDDHFIGSEIPDVPALPSDGKFKKDGKIKRQAARFYIFEYDDSSPGAASIEINGNAANVERIEWTVHLANRKAVWYKFQGLTGENGNYPPNSLRNRTVQPSNPADVESGPRKSLIIDPKPRVISGVNAQIEIAKGQSGDPAETWPAPFVGGKKIESLGTLYTDEVGRLKVAGGYGTSGTPDPNSMPGSSSEDIRWDNNDNWFDDISDGSISASIIFKDGSAQIVQSPAWVIIGPPHFAPPVASVVTMYDVLYDLAIRNFDLNPAIFSAGQFRGGPQGYKPSYAKEIYPILRRALNYRWVFAGIGHNTLTSNDALGKLLAGDPARGARRAIFQHLNNPNEPSAFTGDPTEAKMPWLRGDADAPTALTLTRTQYFLMNQWKDGNFVGDWTGVPVHPVDVSPGGLDIAALENCSGGAFYPGMEAGWIMRNPSIYRKDNGPANLRVRHKTTDPQGVVPGDLTKRMALPWQADFNACNWNWWPATRPQEVRTASDPNKPVRWDAPKDPGASASGMRNVEMVDNWHELGFVKGDPNGTVPLVEDERNWPRKPSLV
jgi:hypothetical protein